MPVHEQKLQTDGQFPLKQKDAQLRAFLTDNWTTATNIWIFLTDTNLCLWYNMEILCRVLTMHYKNWQVAAGHWWPETQKTNFLEPLHIRLVCHIRNIHNSNSKFGYSFQKVLLHCTPLSKQWKQIYYKISQALNVQNHRPFITPLNLNGADAEFLTAQRFPDDSHNGSWDASGILLRRFGTIFSSKCSMAIDDMSRSSCSNSWDRGGFGSTRTNFKMRYISSRTCNEIVTT